MSVRVLIDATAVPADRGGVGRYIDGLVGALADEDVSLAVVTQAADTAAFEAVSDRVEVIAGPPSIASRPARLAWEQTGLPGLARSLGTQVLHCPHYTMPMRGRIPTVVTLHDATFFSHPRLHSTAKGRFFRAATRGALRRATEVLAPSEATRAELVRILRVNGSRITVAHHGYDPTVFAPPSAEAVARATSALGVEQGKYVAFLGTLEPRKNVPALVRGFVASGAAGQYALVLAGGKGWDDKIEPALAAAAPARVIVPGYLPLGDLAGYLGGAAVVAYPSLGEGFGLPVLEAMACGAAVLTTMELSLSEVGGEAVAYCGTDEASIAESLRLLLSDDARRTDLQERAVKRAAQFSWQRCARVHLETYRKAAAA